ncbi:chromate efflux transporter [Cohnella sp. CFH 77786]|uniref:chromate efflux transporter n=1 Tax=Cohnella sp. CFH 77786 TaxID=2662265 RepID=UPI001C60E2C1|nr:chromate efflux transporter [Cohnella sp. CFH 77786]MBW5448168.1 chromate efflux transporter [Cohnella sp. CFH 77786]
MREETEDAVAAPRAADRSGWIETGRTALKLGLSSFGGPIAHIGYFRETYVRRKGWLDEATFADLTAMCQFLPGPASSQLGMAIAMRRAGIPGALAAWAGFTLPSAILMALFAWGLPSLAASASGAIHGLMLAAVAVVAQAVWSMGRSLIPDLLRGAMAIATAAAALAYPGPAGQLLPIILCGILGWRTLRGKMPQGASGSASDSPGSGLHGTPAPYAYLYLIAFGLLLVLLPWLARFTGEPLAVLADIGYRAGSLVFGGGHVVLPMLEHESVAAGLLSEERFVAGYGAAQAVPGPLFTFAAFVGAASAPGAAGWLRAAVMLTAVFLPSFLLVAGAMPYWERLRANRSARSALAGVNASVVGLLLAALYDPVWTSAVRDAGDVAVAAAAFAALAYKRIPPIAVVAACAAAGWIIET